MELRLYLADPVVKRFLSVHGYLLPEVKEWCDTNCGSYKHKFNGTETSGWTYRYGIDPKNNYIVVIDIADETKAMLFKLTWL